jgi:hypothetical protein
VFIIIMLLKFSVLLSSAAYIGSSGAAADPVEFDPTALRLSCSDASSTPSTPLQIAEIDTTFNDVTVLLDPIGEIGAASKGRMCVFSRWTATLEDKTAGNGYYYPLGRSVVGVPGEGPRGLDGDWNRPPGKSAYQLSYLCGSANNTGNNFAIGDYLCEVTLPKTSKQNLKNPILTDEFNPPYYLTYYERSLSVRNELARFLHQTTFGPTSAELDALEATYAFVQSEGSALFNSTTIDTSDNTTTTDANSTTTTTRRLALSHNEAMSKLQVEWVKAQMDPTTFSTGKFTSHREYWRKRLNPRRWETYRIGEAGPAPCELHSRWRKFAFTDYDVQNSRSLRWGNDELGSAYQVQEGHKVTVETVVIENLPSASPSLSWKPSWSTAPTPLPTSGSPTGRPVASLTAAPVSL